ncbi:phosphatase PAP2 family protein [Bradyrhizobium liaoningense]|uniref:phosphatase PAP2 family protein n=1 Tax=Bradyrhizobium liaoningense TaxID=43992 RepID=UPI001BAA0EE5|nr:phosphatase PAP2 family protein [Bradyrhizobium liaoningense]MBR0713487.1 phosphatase PAP2 family protein [Bradyrhizobium liaoningense]
MAFPTVKPTRADVAVANEISAHVSPGVERAAQTLTWGADEHVLLALSIAGWLYAQRRRPEAKPIANHLLAVSLVTTVLTHILKSVFDQTRPDRLTVRGHWRGIPTSGRARDAFPSGHATHMGALASAAGLLPPGRRHLARGLAIGLSLTRITLLAHWTSDVLAGFALGVTVERLLRPLTLTRPRKERRSQ